MSSNPEAVGDKDTVDTDDQTKPDNGTEEVRPIEDGTDNESKPDDGTEEVRLIEDGTDDGTKSTDVCEEVRAIEFSTNDGIEANDGVEEVLPIEVGTDERSKANDDCEEVCATEIGTDDQTKSTDVCEEVRAIEVGTNSNDSTQEVLPIEVDTVEETKVNGDCEEVRAIEIGTKSTDDCEEVLPIEDGTDDGTKPDDDSEDVGSFDMTPLLEGLPVIEIREVVITVVADDPKEYAFVPDEHAEDDTWVFKRRIPGTRPCYKCIHCGTKISIDGNRLLFRSQHGPTCRPRKWDDLRHYDFPNLAEQMSKAENKVKLERTKPMVNTYEVDSDEMEEYEVYHPTTNMQPYLFTITI